MSIDNHNSLTESPKKQLSGSLGVFSIVMMVVATAAPLTVMVASTPVMISMGNGAAAPVDALVATIIMFLFTAGFVSMTQYVSNAGAFYSYIQKGLGRSLGLGAATLSIISYSLILLALEAYVGYAISDTLNKFIEVNIPWWIYSLAVITLIGYLGYRDIELSSKFLGVALFLEISVVIIIDIAVFIHHGVSGMDTRPWQLNTFISGSPGLGILFAIFSFVGFESTVIYREEAKDPDKTLPKATYIAVAVIGVFYVLSMWSEVVGFGINNLDDIIKNHPADMYIYLSENYAGKVVTDIMQVLLITSLFACALSLHNIIVRYQYTLGKQGVLNKRLSDIHHEHGSPYFSSLVQSVIMFAIMGALVLKGADPVAQIYAWGATAGTLGYMIILALTCIAVIFFYSRQKGGNWWNSKVAPTGGLIGIACCIAVAINNLPALVGGTNGNTVATGIFLLLIVSFGVGFITAQFLKLREPGLYASLKDQA